MHGNSHGSQTVLTKDGGDSRAAATALCVCRVPPISKTPLPPHVDKSPFRIQSVVTRHTDQYAGLPNGSSVHGGPGVTLPCLQTLESQQTPFLTGSITGQAQLMMLN